MNAACVRTKVYVSTDATDIDLGHFKREAWATQAMNLVQGKLEVDFPALEANLAGIQQDRKAAKLNTTTATVFMVEFECPRSAPASTGKWNDKSSKQPRRPVFRAALRYVPPPGPIDYTNFYSTLYQMLYDLYAVYDSAGPFVGGYNPLPAPPLGGFNPLATPTTESQASVSSNPDTVQNLIHNPICPAFFGMKIKNVCKQLKLLETGMLNNKNKFPKGTTCPGNYPSFRQGMVDQSLRLDKDLKNNTLPGTFADLLGSNGRRLPAQVNQSTIEAEKATLFWLYDKVQQLGAWVTCDNGQVPFTFAAPRFGPPTFYRIDNEFEFRNLTTNMSNTALALSSMGKDSADEDTFLLVVRGTVARSEWINDFQYNQLQVTEETLATKPLLAPFLSMSILSGYVGLFEQIYPSIKANVTASNPDRILVTGHSLGGGMAQLLALALATDFSGIPVDAAMFAPPAVGNGDFAEAFNTKVNGRRVAYVAYEPGTKYLELLSKSTGDIVPQTPCPDQPVCYFGPTDSENPVPVSTKDPSSLDDYITYQAVDGNVLFDHRYFPDSPASYDLPSGIIRDEWAKVDKLSGGLLAHKCSYACFLSSAVDAELNQCFIEKALGKVDGMSFDEINSKLPENVQKFGLCTI